jgi:hypothetical protein
MNWQNLPDDARVWVYQSNRILTTEEIKFIESEAQNFVQSWNSHGKDLQAAIEVFNQIHLVVMVDENHSSASGCSIDKSVKFVQAIGEELNIDFFDRLTCAIVDGNHISLVKAHEAKSISGIGELELFDNLIDSKGKLATEWRKPVKSTWLSNFLN